MAPVEPGARDARAKAVRDATEKIRAECIAHDNWESWRRQTAPFRAALKARLDELKPFDEDSNVKHVGLTFPPLAGRPPFPLFEVAAQENLIHLLDDHSLDEFRERREVVAARRWLARRNIDLVFVPVPKMTEVYIEHFIEPCPPDGIVNPSLRQAISELLESDVEVVDAYQLLRARHSTAPYLYNAAETHWSPAGMKIVAAEIADRVGRYEFAAAARPRPPVVHSVTAPLKVTPALRALNESQRPLAVAAQAATWEDIRTSEGGPVADDPDSPLLVIGNSYVEHFREELIRAMNLRVRTRWGAGTTTQPFADFLRESELLDGVRVVVWVTTQQHLAHFYPMPDAIMSALRP